MPCDTVTTQSVVLAKAMPELVKKALQETGWLNRGSDNIRIMAKRNYDTLVWEAGKGITITSNNSEAILKEITQAYSKTAVTWAAKRAGWSVKPVNENKITVSRR